MLKELGESIRIGANISSSEASKVIEAVEVKVKQMNDPEVKFLDDGTFSVSEEDGIDFKLG
jgi:hypothetical protein